MRGCVALGSAGAAESLLDGLGQFQQLETDRRRTRSPRRSCKKTANPAGRAAARSDRSEACRNGSPGTAICRRASRAARQVGEAVSEIGAEGDADAWHGSVLEVFEAGRCRFPASACWPPRPWRTGMTTGRAAPNSSMTKNSGGFSGCSSSWACLRSRDFGAVDLVHGEAGEVGELAGDGIALDAGQHDDVLAFFEQALRHVVGVEAADVDVVEFGRWRRDWCRAVGKRGRRRRCSAAFSHTGWHTSATSGSGLSAMSTSFHAPVAEEAHGHLVAGEFALDDFVEVHVFAVDAGSCRRCRRACRRVR